MKFNGRVRNDLAFSFIKTAKICYLCGLGFSSGMGILLGSLLVVWVLIELLHTQIDFLKGGKFNVSIFVMVAIVAFIRKLMVASLKPEKIEVAYYPLVVIGALSLVYWLIKRAERSGAHNIGNSG